jgi:hypothetical protein
MRCNSHCILNCAVLDVGFGHVPVTVCIASSCHQWKRDSMTFTTADALSVASGHGPASLHKRRGQPHAPVLAAQLPFYWPHLLDAQRQNQTTRHGRQCPRTSVTIRCNCKRLKAPRPTQRQATHLDRPCHIVCTSSHTPTARLGPGVPPSHLEQARSGHLCAVSAAAQECVGCIAYFQLEE